jgi:hypothetical protein
MMDTIDTTSPLSECQNKIKDYEIIKQKMLKKH